MSTRREFLQTALGAGAGLAGSAPLARLLAQAASSGAGAPLRVPGKEKLIVNSYRFFDLEMPLAELRSWITPVDLFFVRNHVSEPFAMEVNDWTLTVAGEVEQPLTLRIADLVKLEPATVTNTLECAGNGRANYVPHVPGIQWRRGAVGNARFTGPRLKDVLERAGLKRTAHHVAFRGWEEPPSHVPQFIRSIPLEKALDPATLIALQMNGAPLLKHHGFPARALVPGWIGAASVKWLKEITVLSEEFAGNFMKPGYRMPTRPLAPGEEVKPEETAAITALNVKSVIARPAENARVRRPVQVSGAAWAGENDVVKVEISSDGGQSWNPAQLGREQAKYCWRLWQYDWRPARAGDYILMARASDNAGRVQPESAPWNPSGYLWNGIDKVTVHVA